jgi:Fe-S oxidoreductase
MFSAYADVPAYPLALLVFWCAFALFTLVVARHLRVFAAVRMGTPSTPGEVPRRIGGVVRYAVVQTRMFRDRPAGLMHYALFVGSTILLIGNVDLVTLGIPGMIVGAPLDGLVWAFLVGLQNVMAVVALCGVAWAFGRRLSGNPPRLLRTRTALVILLMITLVVATEFAAQWFEVARYGPIPGAFISNAIGEALGGLGETATEAAFVVLWWAHVVVLSVFLVYIPFNKHFHIYTSFVNVYLRKLGPRAQLPVMDLEREDATFGVRTLADLGWKDLLDGFACTECGRCSDACPAHATGKPLDPRALIMGVRSAATGAEVGLPLVPGASFERRRGGTSGGGPQPAAVAVPLVDRVIPYEAVWDCVTCGACVEACPVLIEHVDTIVGLRRNLVLEDSRFPGELRSAFRNLEQAGNPWGEPRSARMAWTRDLPFRVPTVAALAGEGRLESLEVLYFVGCTAAFDERNRRVARALATCLEAAGVVFAVLGEEESCCGDPARRMGNEYLAQLEATGSEETLRRYGMERRTIVTACPHCFTALSIDTGRPGPGFDVVHHAVFLRRLLAEGRLRVDPAGPAVGSPRSVTLHDSCYLARYAGVVEEPRAILRSIPGLDTREMERSGRQTFCCGAGGGRLWMEETRGTRINAERTREALATGADAVVTECPFCMVMLRDGLSEVAGGALAAGGAAGGVVALDLAEVLAGRLATPASPAAGALAAPGAPPAPA